LVSVGHLEGFYYTPRIDFEVLEKYSEGIIAASACLGGEIPQEIMRSNLSSNQRVDVNNLNLITANQILDKYLAIFGDDFYLELQRHGRNEQEFVNQALVKILTVCIILEMNMFVQ